MKKIFLCIVILIFIVILNTTQLKASEENNEDINNEIVMLLDKTKTTYNYDYLGTLEYGEYYQEIYRELDVFCRQYMLLSTSDSFINIEIPSVIKETYNETQKNNAELKTKLLQYFAFVASAYKRDNPMMYFLRTLRCSIDEYRHDNPEEGISIRELRGVSFVFISYYTYDERKDINEKLCEKIKEYASYAEGMTSEYVISKVFNKVICDNMYYLYDAEGKPSNEDYAHNILGFFLYGKGVCESYAYTFSLLMNYAGVDCFYVCGNYNKKTGVSHAWNIAKMNNGEWYWFDIDVNDDDEKGFEQSEYLCFVEDKYTLNDDYLVDFLFSYVSVPKRAESNKNINDWSRVTHNDVLYRIWADKLYVLDNPKQNEVPEIIEFKWKTFVIDCLHEQLVEKDNCHMCINCLKMHTSVVQDRYVEATCTTDGLTYGKRCADCGYIIEPQEVIPKTGHKLTDWIIDIEPTKDYDGYKHKECIVCNEFVEEEILPKLRGCKQKQEILYSYFLITNLICFMMFRKRK